MKKCPMCAEEIQDEAIKCKHCGSDFSELITPIPKLTDTKSDKVVGGIAGVVTGIGCGGMLIVVGILLSLTGIGAIVGIPLAIAGLLMPIIGPAIGLASIAGPCPYCGSKISGSTVQAGFKCRFCKKRVVIRDKKFMRVD